MRRREAHSLAPNRKVIVFVTFRSDYEEVKKTAELS